MRLLALSLLLLAAGASRAAEPQPFDVEAPIALEGAGPYFRLDLPMAVRFAAHSPELADLRVFNGAGEAVPFSLIRSRAETEQALERSDLKWFPLYRGAAAGGPTPEIRVERNADGTVVSIREGERPVDAAPALRGFILDASGNKEAIRALELDWDAAATSSVQQLSVEASDDLQHWRPWRQGAQLLRLEFQGSHLQRRRIDLPGERADYLRLTWESPENAPELTAAVLVTSRSTHRPATILWSDALLPTVTEDGDFRWQLPQRIAIDRLRLELAEVNVLSPVEISASDGRRERDQEHWQLLARPTLYRLLIDGKEWQQPEIVLEGERVKWIKLRPDRRAGGLGAGAPRLSIGATAQQLLFLARGPAPFRLAVGNGAVSAAELPPATLVPGYDSGAAPPIAEARLGLLALPPSPSSSAPIAPATALASDTFGWRTVVLWAVLLAGVGFIGATALRLLHQTK
jgi:hypothetical protein